MRRSCSRLHGPLLLPTPRYTYIFEWEEFYVFTGKIFARHFLLQKTFFFDIQNDIYNLITFFPPHSHHANAQFKSNWTLSLFIRTVTVSLYVQWTPLIVAA